MAENAGEIPAGEAARVSKSYWSRPSFIGNALVNDDKFEYVNYFLTWAVIASLILALLQFMRQAYNGSSGSSTPVGKVKRSSSNSSSSRSNNRNNNNNNQNPRRDEEEPEDRPYRKL